MGDTIGKVYCGSKCKTDFSDIRFTESDEVTLIDYWLKEKVNGSYAIFEVEIPSIPASGNYATIYIYYGNVSTSSLSNIYNTYGVYIGDDFEECDLARWVNEDSAPGVSDCSSSQIFEGTYARRGYDGVDAGGSARSSKAISASYIAFEVAARVGTVQDTERNINIFHLWNGATIRLRWRLLYDRKTTDFVAVEYRNVSGVWTTVVTGLSIDVWYQLKLFYKNTTLDIFVYSATGASLGSVTGVSGETTGSFDKVALTHTCTTGGSGYTYNDIARYRKYVVPEPTNGAWGSEESPAGPGFKKFIFATEPPTGGQFNKLAYTSEPPTPGAWNQLKREA